MKATGMGMTQAIWTVSRNGRARRTALRATIAALSVGLVLAGLAVQSAGRQEMRADTRCLFSDGLPDHATGRFPNPGNPHAMAPQDLVFCVDAEPVRGDVPRPVRVTGMALNGVLIRPGTADWYDPDARRGHSRDASSGWNLEGLGARDLLGMDAANAHVGPGGEYHYHGPSAALAGAMQGSLMGYAADGFEIHYVGGSVTSSWQLRPGTRASAPGGPHDGTYVEDFVHVPGSGMLDECNGGWLNGRFVYFATDSFPYFPRCLWGSFEETRPGPEGGRRPRG